MEQCMNVYIINRHWAGTTKSLKVSIYRHQSFSDVMPRIRNEVYSHKWERVFFNMIAGGGIDGHIDVDWLLLFFFLQTEDKCSSGWLNPGPMLGRFWGRFSESRGLGAGDPVYFPPWSLLGRDLNNKALFTELPGVPCVQTQVRPPLNQPDSAVLTWPATMGVYLTPH